MVSAIITTHNRVDLLGRAIDSVLNQTYNDIEIIVVSDGSTDGTDDFMSQFVSNDRVNYISYHPGRGGNYARNIGVNAAKGEFVAFLDDDDEWYPTKVEKQIKIMQSDAQIGLVYTGINAIYVNERVSYIHVSEFGGDVSHRILLGNFIGTTSTVMVKKDIAMKAGLFDESLKALQDYDLWIRISQIAHVGFVGQPLINYYNETNKNQVSDKTELYENCIQYIYNKYSDLYALLSKKEKSDLYTNNCLNFAKKCMRNGNRKKGRYYLKKAFRNRASSKVLAYYIISFLPFKYVLNFRRIFNS